MKTNASLRLGKILKILALLFLAAAALLTVSNLLQAKKAAEKSELVLQELSPALEYKIQESSTQTAETLTLPDYVLNPDMEMPCIEVEGNEYIGVLDIPTLELSLPIMAEWDYEKLKIAPCRYTGSVYKNDLIIVAHNYVRHFGKLSTLSYGDDIYFTDVDGNVFHYVIAELEVLQPYAVDYMESNNPGLSLFTCTIGGEKRLTVRAVPYEE